MSSMLRERATGVARDIVAEFPQVNGICLYGSVARGDAQVDSDVDLLVVGDDPALTPSSIRRRLHLQDAHPRISIVYHTPQTLSRYVTTGARFLLHVQLEGEVLYDSSGLLTSIQRRGPVTGPIEPEVEGQLKRLSLYDDATRYNGNFLLPLAHVYAIGKAIVMAILAENEIFEFNRDRAFESFSNRFPDAAKDIEIVRALVPFYRLATKGLDEPLPFSYHDCEPQLSTAICAVRRLAMHARYA